MISKANLMLDRTMSISAIAGHFPLFFWNFASYRVKRKFSIFCSKIIFEKHFSKILVFEILCEGNIPSLEGDLFVTFDRVEVMSFLIDSGKYLNSVFWFCASFQNFHSVEWYPSAFLAVLADFDLLEKSCFAS